MSFNLKPRTFGFLVGTRAALAFGVGLLAASRIPERAAGGSGWRWSASARRRRSRRCGCCARAGRRAPIGVNGARAEFGFVRAL